MSIILTDTTQGGVLRACESLRAYVFDSVRERLHVFSERRREKVIARVLVCSSLIAP